MKQQPTYPLFQITIPGPRPNKSVRFPITLAACLAGTAFQESATPNTDQDDSGGVALATNLVPFAGFTTRDVLAAVNGVAAVPAPTFSELATSGDAANLPFENPFSAGTEGSLQDAETYECEGTGFVSSGNGARDITAATAIGSKLTFFNGVTALAQTNDLSEFYLAEQQTPSVPGNVRIRCKRRYAQVT